MVLQTESETIMTIVLHPAIGATNKSYLTTCNKIYQTHHIETLKLFDQIIALLEIYLKKFIRNRNLLRVFSCEKKKKSLHLSIGK